MIFTNCNSDVMVIMSKVCTGFLPMDDPQTRALSTVPQTDLWQATAVGSFLSFF